MENKRRAELIKRQILVGRVATMRDMGCTTTEIAQTLGLSESSVRSIMTTVEKADEERSKMNS